MAELAKLNAFCQFLSLYFFQSMEFLFIKNTNFIKANILNIILHKKSKNAAKYVN
jgi:hypothetical protein